MLDEFGESLPSESLFVPHSSPRNDRSNQQTGISQKQTTFLKKGR
jgi:hypothetical protein